MRIIEILGVAIVCVTIFAASHLVFTDGWSVESTASVGSAGALRRQ